MTADANEYETIKIPLAQLVDCPLNTRPIDMDDTALRDLGASLEYHQEVDLIVRPVAGGLFEVLDGKRRLAASRLTGTITGLRCQVRPDCSDADALKVILVTQLHRRSLDPLAEAGLVQQLLDGGATAAAVAAELGRAVAWVANRAQLTRLAAAWREGIAAGTYPWASVGYLEQIARLPQPVQEEMAADYAGGRLPPDSLEAFAAAIAGRYLHRLSQAPWDLENIAVLPVAGACSACAKRSGCQQVLWADAIGDEEQCLDAMCWGEKLASHTRTVAAKLAKKHPTVPVLVLVHQTEANHHPAPDRLPETAQVINRYGLEECKKSDDGARPAVDAETGASTWVKPAAWAGPQVRKALEGGGEVSVAAHVRGAGDGPTAADRRAAKRAAFRMRAIDIALADCNPPKLADLLPLYTTFAVCQADPLLDAGWMDANATRSEADEVVVLWEHLVDLLREKLRVKVKPGSLPGSRALRLLEQLATLSPDEQEAKALAEIPDPKGKG